MLKRITSLNILPRWIIICIDAGIILFSVMFAYLLRFNLNLDNIEIDQFVTGVSLFFVCNLGAVLLNKTYSGIIRYTSLEDGTRILFTSTSGSAIVGLINYLNFYLSGIAFIPVSVLIIAYLNTTFFLFSYRIAVKFIFSKASNLKYSRKSAVIYGVGQLGLITKHIIDNDPISDMRVVAYLDDDERKVGKNFNGVKIFHSERDLQYLLRTQRIHKLVIAIQDLSLERKNEIVDFCLRYDIEVQHVPPAYRWVNGELSFNQIKNVKIEDLLGRESIKIENTLVKNELQGKTILITGAAGSIGSEIVRQVIQNNPRKVILFDQAETPLFDMEMEAADLNPAVEKIVILGAVNNYNRVHATFKEHKPDVVFHAAAYKHVPMLEENPIEAIQTNILGTKNLADLSVKFNVSKFVLVSTDKAVNPTNVMGASKRLAEMYVQSLNYALERGDYFDNSAFTTRFITTRFGNVLGSNGSVIPLFRKQIAQGGPVTVTHPEITRFFMTIPEACQLVLEAGVMGKGGEIFIFDMGKAIKILDLAKKMIQLSGLKLGKDIEVEFSGLRPGEKLYEELLSNKENTKPTHNPKILIAETDNADFEKINSEIVELLDITAMDDEMLIVKKMKKLVPSFISNHSKFERLDPKKDIPMRVIRNA
ncbi:MAG: nucleoside-diphosphate sugar epimerase/dehydratase [Cytophagales bacterium]